MGKLQVEFAWSKSRGELFRSCPRAYWYNYYGSWEGWNESHPNRDAYILKNLQNRFAWVGSTVHNQIEKALKRGRSLGFESFDVDAEISAAVHLMREEFKLSRAKKYLENPKKFLGLTEHEYDEPVSPEKWAECRDKVTTCLNNFFRSKVFKDIAASCPSKWIEFEELDSFSYMGVKVWVKLDFGMTEDGYLDIYDWKTSKAMTDEDDIKIQLGTYAYYGSEILKHPIDKIRVHEVNVWLKEKKTYEVDKEMIDFALSKLRESCSEIFVPFGHSPAESAESLHGVIPEADKFHVARTDHPCRFCQFRKICEKFNNGKQH